MVKTASATDGMSGVQIEKDGNSLRVVGAMTMENIHGMLADSLPLLQGSELSLDLGATPEVDSAAISLVFEWLRQAQRRNIRLTFTNIPDPLRSLAALYGVSDLIPLA